MPFYEYQCSSCGHHLEVLQKISDAPLRKCPECGKQQLKRLISAPVFRLKGSGWYETDFKSDNESKRNLVESAEKEPAKESTEKEAAKPAVGESTDKSAKPEAKVAEKSASEPTKKSSGARKAPKAKPVVKLKKKVARR